ncbi:integrase family protein [Opitutaceae bacterium TAV1]|nr:integrase family protein [Opitutaceae bacterium TAV1]
MIPTDPTTFPEPAREKENDTRPPPVVVEALVTLAREAPELSSEEISARLEREYGVRLAKATVTRLLYRHGVRTAAHRRSERMRQAEASLLAGEPVSGWIYNKLLRANPALKERERETRGPGERVCVAQLPVRRPGAGDDRRSRAWVHMAVDMYGGMAMAEFYREATAAAAVAFLRERMVPFYEGEGVRLGCVETNRNHVYQGDRHHECGLYPESLRALGIRHEVRGRQWPETNGFMERFREAFASGFVKPLQLGLGQQGQGWPAGSGRTLEDAMPEDAFYAAREKLAEWLRHYNGETPLEGYPNAGLTPRAFWQGAGTLKAVKTVFSEPPDSRFLIRSHPPASPR